MTPAIDHQTVTINFFGCIFGFAMYPLVFHRHPSSDLTEANCNIASFFNTSFYTFKERQQQNAHLVGLLTVAFYRVHVASKNWGFLPFQRSYCLETVDALVWRCAESTLMRVIFHSWQLTIDIFHRIQFQMMYLLPKPSQINGKLFVRLHFLPQMSCLYFWQPGQNAHFSLVTTCAVGLLPPVTT